jgi:sporulation protein YlmC with PRC-barrel domain
MKIIIAFLISIIGSIVLINPIYAEDTVDKQVGEADRQLQVDPSEYEDEKVRARVTKKNTDEDMRRQDSMTHKQPSQAIITMMVYDQQGKEIGEIQEIRLDTRDGKIQYVTLSQNSSEAGNEKDIAVPLEALCFDQNKVVLAIDENKLEGAPRVGDLSSDEFQRDLQNYYGIAPSWQEEGKKKFCVDANRQDSIKDGINIKSDESKMQNDRNSRLMSPESRDLVSELRKMLLLCNPW